MAIEFQKFKSIARLSRDITCTEKIDGTNGQVIVTDEGEFGVASRTKLITPDDDNFGFAKWAYDNKEEFIKFGPGRYIGEWWGEGIQRRYGIKGKRFSLFNTHKFKENRPACCDIVPTLYHGPFDTEAIKNCMISLENSGSIASPGFMRPEGIVIFHEASNTLFKKTFENDEKGKGQ